MQPYIFFPYLKNSKIALVLWSYAAHFSPLGYICMDLIIYKYNRLFCDFLLYFFTFYMFELEACSKRKKKEKKERKKEKNSNRI